MSRVIAESISLNSVVETALGVPATTGCVVHEPNTMEEVGADVVKIQRNPISINRQMRKGDVVDLNSTVKFSADITKDLLDHFLESAFLSGFKHTGGTGLSYFVPTGVTTTGYTVASLGAVPNNSLVFARGFALAANNGLKVLAGTSTATEIKTAGLATESVAGAYPVSVEVAGWRGASGDIGIDVNGDLTATVANFTTMGLTVGQWIWVGGVAGSAFAFNTAAYRGFARIKTITSGKLSLERRSWTVAAADAGAAKTIDLYWGRWVRNVIQTSGEFLERTHTFEVGYPTLGGPTTPEYEYAKGNYLNELTLDIPVADKATASLGFIGTTCDDPTTTRATGFSTARVPLGVGLINTASDILRVRMSNTDETGLSTDLKGIKVTFMNNVSAEKVLGTLGARFMNVGKFQVKVEGEFLFTDDGMVKGVRDNRSVSFDLGLRDPDGGCLIDIPSMTLDSTKRKIAANTSVTLDGSATAFQDPVLGISASVSLFPYLPAA